MPTTIASLETLTFQEHLATPRHPTDTSRPKHDGRLYRFYSSLLFGHPRQSSASCIHIADVLDGCGVVPTAAHSGAPLLEPP